MKGILKKEEEKDLLEMELDEIRKDYSNPNSFDKERTILKEFNVLRKEKTPADDQKKRKDELSKEIGMLYGLENSLWVANVGYHERDCLILARMRKKILEDYNCKTSLELILADSIAVCYLRIIRNERRINCLIDREDYSYSFGQIAVNYIKELNKEVDLANRRLAMNIILLKEMKQPALKVNVKTTNAFIGEKQQFNNNAENNEAK